MAPGLLALDAELAIDQDTSTPGIVCCPAFRTGLTLANCDWCATISVSSDVSRDVIREERRRKLRECGARLVSEFEPYKILEATDNCVS